MHITVTFVTKDSRAELSSGVVEKYSLESFFSNRWSSCSLKVRGVANWTGVSNTRDARREVGSSSFAFSTLFRWIPAPSTSIPVSFWKRLFKISFFSFCNFFLDKVQCEVLFPNSGTSIQRTERSAFLGIGGIVC